MAFIQVQPAYGRDYKSKAEVLADWKADKDFQCVGFGQHGYINRPDRDKYSPNDTIEVRYFKGQRVMMIQPGE